MEGNEVPDAEVPHAQVPNPRSPSSAALAAAAREVEDFLTESGWDQPPQLFALVPTSTLREAEPELADTLPTGDGLTPVAQEPLESEDLGETLSGIYWPDDVPGCVIAQEIVVLPPQAESELDRAVSDAADEQAADTALRIARSHPDRRDARLVVAVLREGGHCCLLRVRGVAEAPDEVIEHPDLAPNMVEALRTTLTDPPPAPGAG